MRAARRCLLALAVAALGAVAAEGKKADILRETAEVVGSRALEGVVMEPERGAPLESVRALEMNQTSEDLLELYFEVRNESYTFELKRFKGFYGAKANARAKNLTHDETDTAVYDAHFTFITPTKSEQMGVVTVMPDGTAHGIFVLEDGHFFRISSEGHFQRKLGEDGFRGLRAAGELLDASHGADRDASHGPRYLAAQVLAPRAGSSEEHRGLLKDFDDAVDGQELRVSASRRRALASCTFPDYYTAYEIGIVVDSDFLEDFNNDEAAVARYVEATVAESNLIFRSYAQVILRVKELTFNDFGACSASITDAHDEVKAYAANRDGVAHWHRLSGCAFGGVAGKATVGTLCYSNLRYATAISAFGSYGETFLTFLHEVGHAFGAEHPFSGTQDMGTYGGIMDYNTNGKLKGTSDIGFTQSSLAYFCSTINKLNLNGACSFASVYSDEESTCGDGIISGDEECECPDGREKCGKGGFKCVKCKLRRSAMVCSSNFLMKILHGPAEGSQAHEDCCSSSGELKDALTPCNVDKSGNAGGYCSLGQCVNRCEDYKGALTLCGVMSSRNGCRQQCNHPTGGYCTGSLWYRDYNNKVTYATNLEDGSKCTLDSGKTGMCSSGSCVTDDEAN